MCGAAGCPPDTCCPQGPPHGLGHFSGGTRAGPQPWWPCSSPCAPCWLGTWLGTRASTQELQRGVEGGQEMSRAVPGRRGRAHSTEPACAGDNGQEIRARRQRDMLRGEGSLSSTEGCRQAQGGSFLLVLGPVALGCSLYLCRPSPWLPAALCLAAHPPAGRESARDQLGSWPPSVSPPANPRWCSTDWVQVSRAMLTPSTVLQDTFLGLALLFLEHREGRGTCTQPGEHTAPHAVCTLVHARNAALSAHTPCTHTSRVSTQHSAQAPVQPVCTPSQCT